MLCCPSVHLMARFTFVVRISGPDHLGLCFVLPVRAFGPDHLGLCAVLPACAFVARFTSDCGDQAFDGWVDATEAAMASRQMALRCTSVPLPTSAHTLLACCLQSVWFAHRTRRVSTVPSSAVFASVPPARRAAVQPTAAARSHEQAALHAARGSPRSECGLSSNQMGLVTSVCGDVDRPPKHGADHLGLRRLHMYLMSDPEPGWSNHSQ